MDDKKLLAIFNSDEFGLLEEIKKAPLMTSDDRFVESFLEINEFVDAHKREPIAGDDIHERRLATRLMHIREDAEKADSLKEYDMFGLLTKIKEETEDDKDILEDEFGLLDVGDTSIFDIKNVPNIEKDRSDPDFVATRKPCADFNHFELLFKQCQDDLEKGVRKLAPFVEADMKEGDFFVLKGALIYLDKVSTPYLGNSKKINRRTRCIYENGLESDLLLRSLGKRLSEVGKAVKYTHIRDTINDDDQNTGYIYILESLSDDPQISSLKNLYKIGFSSVEVEERIKNAESDPTYLMAPVKIVAAYKCFNMNPQRFERLIHRFFSEVCLDLTIGDKNGFGYKPSEWFTVPLKIIDDVIDLIISGEILKFRYDKDNKILVEKDRKAL
jgi:T5orf172 domain